MQRIDYYQNGDNRVTLCDRGEDCQTLPRYCTGGFIAGRVVGDSYLELSGAQSGFRSLRRKADTLPAYNAE